MRFEGESEAPPEVDLAPLIDCVFLLLIFFLVATQLSEFEEHLEFSLPETTAQLSPERAFSFAEITMDARGRLMVTNREAFDKRGRGRMYELDSAEFREEVAKLARERGADIELFVNVHPETEFQVVTKLLDLLKTIGFSEIDVRVYGIKGDF